MNVPNHPSNTKAKYWRPLLAGLLLGNWITAGAALSVPNTPIFLANDVQANIFFSLDDSGSMDWEVTKTNGAMTAHPTAPNSGNLDFSPNNFTEDREMCVGYSVMAYNPAVTYVPWFGVDENGDPYQNQAINAALWNPYDANGFKKNLLNADFYGLCNRVR